MSETLLEQVDLLQTQVAPKDKEVKALEKEVSKNQE